MCMHNSFCHSSLNEERKMGENGIHKGLWELTNVNPFTQLLGCAGDV